MLKTQLTIGGCSGEYKKPTPESLGEIFFTRILQILTSIPSQPRPTGKDGILFAIRDVHYAFSLFRIDSRMVADILSILENRGHVRRMKRGVLLVAQKEVGNNV